MQIIIYFYIEVSQNTSMNQLSKEGDKNNLSEFSVNRRISKRRQSYETNDNFNDNRNTDKNNINHESPKAKIINNYVQITNIININENFNQELMQPNIEIETKRYVRKRNTVVNNVRKSSNI